MAYPHESKYKKEDNWGERKSCGDNTYTGIKTSERPSIFCDPITVQQTLDVVGSTTLSSQLTVGGNASVAGSLSCGTLCASTIDWGCQSNAAGGSFQFPAPAQFTGGDVIIGNSSSRSGGGSLVVAGSTIIREDLSVTGESTFSNATFTALGATTLSSGSASISNLTVSGGSNLSVVTTTGALTVGGALISSNFVFQGQTISVRTIDIVTRVNFNSETVTTESVTILGP